MCHNLARVANSTAGFLSSTSPGATFRADIEGLRGVAVLAVLGFHAAVSGFAGGFVGVDVFFVISGYLITAQLFRESAGSGTIRLARFWSRRVRRLVPALALTVVGTLALAALVQSPLAWTSVAGEARSALLYVSNIKYAREALDYFRDGATPLLHTWSLAVEEQFYVVWPLLVLLAAKLPWGKLRSRLLIMLSAVFASSLVLCVALTWRGTPWAFYSSPTRAWQFAAGGLLALVPGFASRVRPIVGIVGAALLVGPVIWFDPTSRWFPGPLAAVPTAGAALLLVAGSTGPIGRVLTFRPLRFAGRVSYSWYLWHWPLLVFAEQQWPSVGLAGRLGAVAVAFFLSIVTERFVERPPRELPYFQRIGPALAIGVVVTLVAGVATVGLQQLANSKLRSPFMVALKEARAGRSLADNTNCNPRVFGDERVCVLGPVGDNVPLIVLLGDSHAAQWEPAFAGAAEALGVAVVVRAYGGCPAIPIAIAGSQNGQQGRGCLAYRARTADFLKNARPNLVVIAQARYPTRVLGPDGRILGEQEAASAWALAMTTLGRELADLGSAIAYVADNPSFERDPLECLAKARRADACSSATKSLLPDLDAHTERDLASLEPFGVQAIFRSQQWICPDDRCRPFVDGMPAYSDSNHLSVQFVRSKELEIERFLAESLNKSG